jgi:hypothetical protein
MTRERVGITVATIYPSLVARETKKSERLTPLRQLSARFLPPICHYPVAMPKRRLIRGILALGIFAALIFTFTRRSEPSYKGRALGEWVDRIRTLSGLSSQVPTQTTQNKEAADAIRHIGTNAIPYLLLWMKGEQEPLWKPKLRSLAMRLPLRIRPLWAYDKLPRSLCLHEAFAILGSQAETAIPELSRLANDTNDYQTAFNATAALASLGNDGLPPLLALLTNQNDRLRLVATTLIFCQGTNAWPAVPALFKMLKDPDPEIRKAANHSLSCIAPETLTNAPPR